MPRAFTTKTVEALKPDPEKRREVPDPALPGLYIIVQTSGVKSWALRYRFEGKPAKLTLGRWPLMGLAEARKAAGEALEQLAHGSNPARARADAKDAQIEAQLKARDTVKALVEQFDRRHLAGLRSGKEARRFLDRFVVEAWGERDVHTVTRRDVIDLLNTIKESGRATTANRVRAHASKFFNWCVERDVIETAPTLGVRAPAKEVTRDRVLSDDEVRWFWQACEEVGPPWGAMGQMLLLTGQRLREVAEMTEAELRPGGIWHLAAARTKNKRAHDVPLSEAATAVLAKLPRLGDKPRFLFSTNGRTAVSGFAKAKTKIAQAMVEIASRERGSRVEIPPWTFHDLRRTAATGLARLGTPVRVTEAVLNHVSGTGGGIVAVYQRHDFAEEKREALEAWGRRVTEQLAGIPRRMAEVANA